MLLRQKDEDDSTFFSSFQDAHTSEQQLRLMMNCLYPLTACRLSSSAPTEIVRCERQFVSLPKLAYLNANRSSRNCVHSLQQAALFAESAATCHIRPRKYLPFLRGVHFSIFECHMNTFTFLSLPSELLWVAFFFQTAHFSPLSSILSSSSSSSSDDAHVLLFRRRWSDDEWKQLRQICPLHLRAHTVQYYLQRLDSRGQRSGYAGSL